MRTGCGRARAWQIGSNIVTSKTPFVFQQFHDAEIERWTKVNHEAVINP